jgi:hypothetical protein
VEPRIAISFVCSDPEYEPPLLVNHAKYFPTKDDSSTDDNGDQVRFPPLKIRLLLVCAQLLIYYQRFELDKAVIKACYDYCKIHEVELQENYRHKVYLEFVKAMKEQQQETETNESQTKAIPLTEDNDEDTGDDDDDEEAVLEEMLNAEQGGYGEFEDDYDEIEEEIQREESEKIDFEDRREEKLADEWEEEGKLSLLGKRETDDVADVPGKKAKET